MRTRASGRTTLSHGDDPDETAEGVLTDSRRFGRDFHGEGIAEAQLPGTVCRGRVFFIHPTNNGLGLPAF